MTIRNEKDEWRKIELSKILSNIYGYKDLSVLENSDGTIEVLLGESIGLNKCSFSIELNKCSFSDKYKKKYDKLLWFTFISESCIFTNKNKKKKKFTREEAVKGAIKYLKKWVDLQYSFYAEKEKQLFAKLLYKLIKKVIDVLFDDDTDKRKSINEFFDNILHKDIIDMIYDKIKLEDVETSFDSKYEKGECVDSWLYYCRPEFAFTYDYLLNKYAGVYIRRNGKVIKDSFKKIDKYESEYHIVIPESIKQISFIKMIELPVDYKYPSLYCIKTNDIKEHERAKEKVSNSKEKSTIFNSSDVTNEIELAIENQIINKYREEYSDLNELSFYEFLKRINDFLKIASQINYLKFIKGKTMLPGLKNSFKTFKDKTSSIFEDDEMMPFYKYLFIDFIDRAFYSINHDIKYISKGRTFNGKDYISIIILTQLKKLISLFMNKMK